MSQTQVARLFRSPELGRLATLAVAQGWDVARLSGGHVAATNPRTGARVQMSGTGYVTRGTLRAKVHEFVQAGLDPDWTRKADRARQRQEATPMQVHDVPRTDPPPVTEVGTREVIRNPGVHLTQGGRYAYVGAQEVLDVAGYQVRLGLRADGTWVATTPDATQKRRVRQWYAQDREAVLGRVAEGVVARPPDPNIPPRKPQAPRRTEDPSQGVRVEAAPGVDSPPTPVVDRLARARQAGYQSPDAGSFHVVQADPAEFPLAAALDALDVAMAPALAALDAAGKADAAGLLRGELVRSAVESELLALYRRVLRGE